MPLKFIEDENTFKSLARRIEQELAAASDRNDRDALIAVCVTALMEHTLGAKPDFLTDGATRFLDQLDLPRRPKLSQTQQALARAFTGNNYQTLKATWPNVTMR